MLKHSLMVALFIFSALTTYFQTPYFIDMFSRGNKLAKNFQGELIPQGIGILFILCSLPGYALYLALAQPYSKATVDAAAVLLLFLAFVTVSLLGFIDDMLGSRDVLGLRGHLKAFLSGKLTTGSLKAIGGLLVSFLVSIFLSAGVGEIIISTLVLALFTNLLNLLDLRPGRAIKFYFCLLFIFGLSSLVSGAYQPFVLMLPLIGTVLGYFPFDLKARCMMGDAGSNVLGMSAGILAVSQLDYYGKLIALVILTALHIFTERHSLSAIIANSRILSLFDNLGRQN